MRQVTLKSAVCALLLWSGAQASVMGQELSKNFTTPKEEGYTLARTTQVDGLTCEHYEKGSSELRTLRKPNGDFITYAEDPDGFNKAPESNDAKANNAVGSYRFTHSDGIVMTRANDTLTVKLKNGNILYMTNVNVMWSFFVKPYAFYEQLPKFYRGKIVKVALASNPKVTYKYYKGITIGNRGYWCDSKGNFEPYVMTVPVEGSTDGRTVTFYAGRNDSIVKAEQKGKKEQWSNTLAMTYYYANGDKVIISDEDNYMLEGSIRHFKNGVLKVKNGKMNFTSKDGAIFVGYFKEQLVNGSYTCAPEASVLRAQELTPWDGTIQLADGTMDDVVQGKSRLLMQKEANAELAKLKSSVKQKLAQLGQKYGAAYVTSLSNNGVIKVGTPMACITEYLDITNPTRANNYEKYKPSYKEPSIRDVAQYGKTAKRVELWNFIGYGTSARFMLVNGKVAAVYSQNEEALMLDAKFR